MTREASIAIKAYDCPFGNDDCVDCRYYNGVIGSYTEPVEIDCDYEEEEIDRK